MNDENKKISSYEKGVKRLLENSDLFEWIIANYIIDTYNKFKSNVFPTTQIAKILLDKLNRKKTQYGIIHKVVREIFKIYEKEDICKKIKEGRRSAEKKTKIIYRITDYGIKILKSKLIGFNIKSIEGTLKEDIPIPTKTREEYLLEYIEDIFDEIDRETIDENDENDEANDEDEEGKENE
ncbi:MAG: hypothetical protein ACTSRZ_19620 [Promethearchaeota archaeon]